LTPWLCLVAIALTSLAGCGGSKVASPPSIDATLFVPNYVEYLNGNLFHWDHLPVRIAFELPTNWHVLFPLNPNLHIDAANEWNQPGKQPLTVVVPSKSEFDVYVKFVPQAELGGNYQGLTEYTRDSTGRLLRATIKITLYTSEGKLLSPADVQATIAHEIGHAIGIGGHSPYPEDLMYSTLFLGKPQIATQRDLNTAMTAYPAYFTRTVPFETRSPTNVTEVETEIIY
jgi:hypothetical protein